MDEYYEEVPLPRTAAVWANGDSDELDNALDNDLSDAAADLAANGCESGGWPEDSFVEVSDVEVLEDTLRVEFIVYFNEEIPSGCPEITHGEKRERRLVAILSFGDVQGTISVADTDLSGWNIADRNSAADGT